MDTYTVLPFLVAFMAGLVAMRALNIYDIHAWNVGTTEVDPWRSRSSGISRAAATALSWLTRVFRSRTGRVCAAVCLALLVAHLASAHTSTGLLMAVVVPAATPRERREQREKLITDAGALMGANNTFETDEKRTQFDAHMKDIETLTAACTKDTDDERRASTHAAIARVTLPESQRQVPAAGEQPDAAAAAAKKALNERAMNLYLRGVDMSEMVVEERAALRDSYVTFNGAERRDMSTISGAAGGFLVAPDTRFYAAIIMAKKFFGGMEAVGSEVINTDTAGPMPIPMGDDTGNVGSRVPEALASGHAGGVSTTFTQLVLGGYLYSSKSVKLSWQILRDAATDVETKVGALLGERLARIENTEFTNYAGAAGPQGLMPAENVGRQAAVGNTTSIPFDDIYRLIHSVDPAYRTPACKFMMADATALLLRLAKDGQGRYLWPEMGNVQVGQPGVLAGYPFVINNDMPTVAASNKSISFGDHSYYKIRRVKGITVVRINELYVESGQVGFLAFESADGGLADAGQHPVRAFQQSSS
jgi:HK97 family phage major capsid protein